MRDFSINFMKHSAKALLLSLVMVVASLGLVMFRGLNLGIDFTGGNVVQVEFAAPATVEDIRPLLAEIGQGGSVIQSYSDRGLIIRISANEEEARKKTVETLRAKYPGMQVIRLEKVGPVVGSELRQEALIALVLALGGILIYITVRFQFRFAVVSVVALIHDAVITLGLFSLTGMEISSSFIAAILTIVGYSLNNTIVILDSTSATTTSMVADASIPPVPVTESKVTATWLSGAACGVVVSGGSTAAAGVTMNEAVGAFIVSALLIALCGFTGWFERIIDRIPVPLASALLAGVLGLRLADGTIVAPLLATQILWINLLTDSAPALALGLDPLPPYDFDLWRAYTGHCRGLAAAGVTMRDLDRALWQYSKEKQVR